jgi:hypothetical protein
LKSWILKNKLSTFFKDLKQIRLLILNQDFTTTYWEMTEILEIWGLGLAYQKLPYFPYLLIPICKMRYYV